MCLLSGWPSEASEKIRKSPYALKPKPKALALRKTLKPNKGKCKMSQRLTLRVQRTQ